MYATGLGKGTKLKNGRQHRVDWLRKKFEDDQPCQTLADKLHSCKPQARCKSPACPECAYAARRLLTTTIKKYLDDQSKAGNSIVCVSVVPANGITSPGPTFSRPAPTERPAVEGETLGRARVIWFLGGSDWSFNEHEVERYQPHWSHHLYGFTTTPDPEDLKKRLQVQFPKSDAIPRPVKVQAWDGKKKPIRYMMKAKFFRRIGKTTANGSTRPTATTGPAAPPTNNPYGHPRSVNCSSISTRSVSKDDWSCAGSKFCISGPRARLCLNVVRAAVCA